MEEEFIKLWLLGAILITCLAIIFSFTILNGYVNAAYKASEYLLEVTSQR